MRTGVVVRPLEIKSGPICASIGLAGDFALPAGLDVGNRTEAMHNKRLEALRSNPGGDWTPADLEITASQYAIKFRKVTGTHEVFLHPSVPNCVTVPLKNKMRPTHVRAFVAMIDRMEELDV